MAVKRVGPQDIININELYLIHKTKAEVARQTGFSASTVAKYIIPDYKPSNTEEFPLVNEKKLDFSVFDMKYWNDLVLLSKEEFEEMVNMRKEINL